MYTIGSKVVHPGHGAGTIIDIQKKSLGDVSRTYYVIDTVTSASAGTRQLMVPVPRAKDAGLRRTGKASRLRAILDACEDTTDDDIERDYRSRQASIRELLNSGSFKEVAGAVAILYRLHTERPLGITDRQLYDHGKEILAGELALAANLKIDEALAELEDRLSRMMNDHGEG